MDSTKMTPELKILFLCTGNSCRSQIAEGFARSLKSDCIEPYSAGIETHGMNPNVVEVMREVGVDMSSHRSKHLDELSARQNRALVRALGKHTGGRFANCSDMLGALEETARGPVAPTWLLVGGACALVALVSLLAVLLRGCGG